MKVHREEPKFKPVVITLETQEEVDQLDAIFHHASICPFDGVFSDSDELLHGFATKNTDYFGQLEDRLKKAYAK